MFTIDLQVCALITLHPDVYLHLLGAAVERFVLAGS